MKSLSAMSAIDLANDVVRSVRNTLIMGSPNFKGTDSLPGISEHEKSWVFTLLSDMRGHEDLHWDKKHTELGYRFLAKDSNRRYTLPAYFKSDNMIENVARVAACSSLHKLGNCQEMAYMAMLYLSRWMIKLGPDAASLRFKLHSMGYADIDHLFVLITWRDQTVICDPWLGYVCAISTPVIQEELLPFKALLERAGVRGITPLTWSKINFNTDRLVIADQIDAEFLLNSFDLHYDSYIRHYYTSYYSNVNRTIHEFSDAESKLRNPLKVETQKIALKDAVFQQNKAACVALIREGFEMTLSEDMRAIMKDPVGFRFLVLQVLRIAGPFEATELMKLYQQTLEADHCFAAVTLGFLDKRGYVKKESRYPLVKYVLDVFVSSQSKKLNFMDAMLGSGNIDLIFDLVMNGALSDVNVKKDILISLIQNKFNKHYTDAVDENDNSTQPIAAITEEKYITHRLCLMKWLIQDENMTSSPAFSALLSEALRWLMIKPEDDRRAMFSAEIVFRILDFMPDADLGDFNYLKELHQLKSQYPGKTLLQLALISPDNSIDLLLQDHAIHFYDMYDSSPTPLMVLLSTDEIPEETKMRYFGLFMHNRNDFHKEITYTLSKIKEGMVSGLNLKNNFKRMSAMLNKMNDVSRSSFPDEYYPLVGQVFMLKNMFNSPTSSHDELFKRIYQSDLDDDFKSMLIKNELISINQKDSSGKTPLYHAIQNRDETFALTLIQLGADVNLGPRATQSPLKLALVTCQYNIVKALLNANANGFDECLQLFRYADLHENLRYLALSSNDRQDEGPPKKRVDEIMKNLIVIMNSDELLKLKSILSNCSNAVRHVRETYVSEIDRKLSVKNGNRGGF